MLSLVYVSSASRALDEEDLATLLAAARANNERSGVTGLLLYNDGNFMQALEGPDDAVKSTFDRIRRDARHHGVLLLLKEQIDERRFPNWSMSIKNVHGLSEAQRAQLDPFLSAGFTDQKFRHDPTSATKLLLAFRDVVR